MVEKQVRRGCKFATLTKDGTAMYEIVLTEDEYNDPQIRAKAETQAARISDCSNPVQWADVTENDAFDTN